MSNEHKVQNEGRNALAGRCLNFRANVGRGWNSSQPAMVIKRTQQVIVQPGDVVLRQARPFDTGLPPGFGDTFGLTPEVVTPEWYERMKGKTVGIFHMIEYKDTHGRLGPKQAACLQAVRDNGGRAGVARSAAEAVRIALGDVA